MIKPYYKPDEPTEPYFLLRAFDLGRIQEIIIQLKVLAIGLTDKDGTIDRAVRILEKANIISYILKEDK